MMNPLHSANVTKVISVEYFMIVFCTLTVYYLLTISGIQATMFKGHTNRLQSVPVEECPQSTRHPQVQR